MMVSHGQKVYVDDVHGHLTPVIARSCYPWIKEYQHAFKNHESNEQNLGCLGYIGDYTAQLCG